MFGNKKNIVIVGAGKIAGSLTPALIKAGYGIAAVVSRNIKSARKLADKNSVNIYSDDYADIPSSCRFYILCVPDGSIKEAAIRLSKLKTDFAKSLFIHMSGAEDISALNSLKSENASVGSLHLMQTFPSVKPLKISGSYASIETDSEKVYGFLDLFARDLGLFPFRILSQHKTLYHLAGVYSSNFLSGNMFIAEKLLKFAVNENKIAPSELLTPIIKATLKNINETGPVNSLSGPVERGDIATVKKHLSALNKLSDKIGSDENILLKYNYIQQSLMLLEIAKQKYGSLSGKHLKIKELLEKEIKKLNKKNLR